MRLKELEARMYVHLRNKIPRTERKFLDSIVRKGIGTNEDYINDRIKEMKIPELIERFGPEADVWWIWAHLHKSEELPSNIIAEAFTEFYSGEGGETPPPASVVHPE